MKEMIRENVLDEEWVLLVAEAKEMGMSVEEVRSFLLTRTKSI